MDEVKGETRIEMINENASVKKVSTFLLFLKTMFHFVVLVHHYVSIGFGISIYVNLTEEQLKEPLILMAKTYFLAFFTIWNFSFQTTFLCLALTYDVLQWLDKEGGKFGQKIKYFRDIVFNGLVFPFTCFVHFMFWALYFIDRELVFPTVYDQILPWWLNHCVHTNIIIVLIIETILTSRRYPTDVKVETIIYVFINIFYAVVFYSIYFFAGCWLYGVFGVMNWWQVCIYQCGISLSAYLFYHSAFFFNRLIHGPENTEQITATTNGDVESKNVKEFNGNEMRIACVENIQIGDTPKLLKDNVMVKNGSNGEKANGEEFNGEKSNGEKLNEDSKVSENGHNDKNGKDWRSFEENGNGVENGAFEKSWSTKYRTSRNEFDNSSL
ncbi:androgen-dependent TFPI-regulating protein-like isoform X2 [Choristoneura fumiferana]|uniref:androgen-dependent TFPI-regulating protein-like isoform X2 n=1 Tax=Choristoneura fumiferana TaxID=7141 RepID=UPI003D155BC3